jgi:hypothetical protein
LTAEVKPAETKPEEPKKEEGDQIIKELAEVEDQPEAEVAAAETKPAEEVKPAKEGDMWVFYALIIVAAIITAGWILLQWRPPILERIRAWFAKKRVQGDQNV